MIYENITEGKFLSRPNRFIAEVEINGEKQMCHVKNTGRCKELLIKGARVFLQKTSNPHRKTLYDLISVYKGDILINMDSQAPNKVFYEWIQTSGFFKDIALIKPEARYKNSRFDFFMEADGKKSYIEVKGVTLEKDGVLLFPDAPTQRGIKHLNELADAVQNGYGGYIFFVAQMKNGKYFTPNTKTHPEFSQTLKKVKEKGVGVYCVNCDVGKETLHISNFIKVVLD